MEFNWEPYHFQFSSNVFLTIWLAWKLELSALQPCSANGVTWSQCWELSPWAYSSNVHPIRKCQNSKTYGWNFKFCQGRFMCVHFRITALWRNVVFGRADVIFTSTEKYDTDEWGGVLYFSADPHQPLLNKVPIWHGVITCRQDYIEIDTNLISKGV